MKTTENNKLIAEYMQFEQLKNNHYQCIINNETKILPPQSMLFNSDWNWLMEVVQEITTTTEFHTDYPKNSIFWDAYNQIDKTEIYNACIEFIKWYNEKRK